MPLDTTSYYPATPGSSCEPDPEETDRENLVKPQPEVGGDSRPHGMKRGDKDSREPDAGVVDKIATLLSWVLVPLLMPLYGTLLIFNQTILAYTSTALKWSVSLVVFGITVAVPMLLVILLKHFGLVNDIGLNDRKERFIPYVITILSMAGSGWFMLVKHAPEWVGMFYMGGAAAALVCLVVNFWWKISAHGAGIAGIVALLVRIGSYGLPGRGFLAWLVVWVMLSGLMGASRVWLGRHTVWQVLAGFAVGYTSVILMTLV